MSDTPSTGWVFLNGFGSLTQTQNIPRSAVSDRRGRYQTRTIPVIAHPTTTVSWRAVGDPELVADLLAGLDSIGKHRAVGEGRVTRWHITETPELDEWAAGHEHDPGVLGRTAPPRCLTNTTTTTGPLGTGTLRPPYLHPASRSTTYQPAR